MHATKLKSLLVTAVLTLAVTAGVLLDSEQLTAAPQNGGTSPVHNLQTDGGDVEVFVKFTKILQHSARIKKVLDFDADVVRIDAVQGHPDQITVYALKAGITTVTLIDEFDNSRQVEILVRGDVRHLQSFLKRHFPDDAVEVEEINGSVLLAGWVTQPEHINQIVSIAETFYPEVLNQMRIGGVQQVMLKATVMEVNRSKIRQFGMNFGLIGNSSYATSTPGPITPITGLTASTAGANVTFSGFSNPSVTFGFINPNRVFQGFIRAFKTEGLLKIHATPMVVTHNGAEAELLNGGETPVLVPAGLGTTGIEFKPFGIILKAVPNILGNGRLRLQVEPSVVERDFANAVTVDGTTVPSFSVRKVSTQVEMNFGETLVIGGLVARREDGTTAKLPFFGEIPWLGTAFSTKQYTESETELVILITPQYVAPMTTDQLPAGGPGRFTVTPTETELMIDGLLEVPSSGPDCEAVFNCNDCNQNGFCYRHPNGRWGVGTVTRHHGHGFHKGAGGPGCTDVTTPTLISPGVQQRQSGGAVPAPNSAPPGEALLAPPALEVIPDQSGIGQPEQADTIGHSRVLSPASRRQPEKKSSTRGGLLAPLLR